MPYLTPKPKKSQAWIPSQVDYGIDCSDPDPEKWTAFGAKAEELLVKTTSKTTKADSKTD